MEKLREGLGEKLGMQLYSISASISCIFFSSKLTTSGFLLLSLPLVVFIIWAVVIVILVGWILKNITKIF